MITFKDIPGRQVLKNKLAGEIRENRPGHAYIFEGPAGCGKKAFAKAFAYMILCMSESEIKPCGKCRHCTSVSAGGMGELYIIDNEGKSISVKSIRELQQNIILLPVGGHKKVYIIVDGDEMTAQAQNCILKTLEEPPEYAYIIITASNSERLIDTVKSRAATVQIGINSTEEIMKYLKKRTNKTESEIQVAALCSAGILGKAMEILDSEDFKLHRELAFLYTKSIMDKEYKEAYETGDKLNKNGINIFFASLTGILRDMLVWQAAGDQCRLINMDRRDIIINGANRYLGNVLMRLVFIVEHASGNISANASKRQSMDAMTIRITEELAKW